MRKACSLAGRTGEGDGSRRQIEGVVVRLEDLEPRAAGPPSRSSSLAAGSSVTSQIAPLRRAGVRAAARRLGQELGAEADAEYGHPARKRLAQHLARRGDRDGLVHRVATPGSAITAA